jgi:Methyltransferase domain
MDIDSFQVAEFATAIESYLYARDHMSGKPRFEDREHLLNYALDQISIEGMILEFGVFSGHTINIIAKKLAHQEIYGFDAFKGLPEDWTGKVKAGHFARNDIPVVRENVKLIIDWFDRSLPAFLDQHSQPVSLLHVDCDIYTSTQTVLTQLRSRIVKGTIIVFDEYFNYID